MFDYYWTNDKTALLEKLWCKDGLTATQCAAVLRTTRNAVIGKVHRMKYPKRKAQKFKPAPASVLKPVAKQTGNNGSAGKYRGLIAAARKARAAIAPPPDMFTPDVATLAVGAWDALPGTAPVALEFLARDGCRWPIGEDSPFLFCACNAVIGSSYCAAHKERAFGMGTRTERRAIKDAEHVRHI
jgi:GcrA cell cycle regulator